MPARFPVDLGAVRGRHPQHFQRFDRGRQMVTAVAAAAFVLLVFAMSELGFFDGKLLAGMGRLVEITGLMLPPDPKDWAHVRLFSSALLETIAISLLGTLMAAADGAEIDRKVRRHQCFSCRPIRRWRTYEVSVSITDTVMTISTRMADTSE